MDNNIPSSVYEQEGNGKTKEELKEDENAKKLEAIKNKKKLDKLGWETAQAINTISSYKSYLLEQEDGSYRSTATHKIKNLERILAENKRLFEKETKNKENWNKAMEINTIQSYQSYLNNQDNTLNRNKATIKLNDLVNSQLENNRISEEKTKKEKERLAKQSEQKQIQGYISSANNYAMDQKFVLAIKKLKRAQNIEYSASVALKIEQYKKEGSVKARVIMGKIMGYENDGIDDCNGRLMVYYKQLLQYVDDSNIQNKLNNCK